MPFIIAGTLNYASQANRDAARTRLNTATSGYSFSNVTTGTGTGIANSGTLSITISIQLTSTDPQVAESVCNGIFTALTSSNRYTSGYLSVNKV